MMQCKTCQGHGYTQGSCGTHDCEDCRGRGEVDLSPPPPGSLLSDAQGKGTEFYQAAQPLIALMERMKIKEVSIILDDSSAKNIGVSMTLKR